MSTARRPRPASDGWLDIRSPNGRLLGRYHPELDRLWLRNGRDEKFVDLIPLRVNALP